MQFSGDTDRKHYLAEAYGMRALYYFMLYRTYGGVPIVTEVELLNGKVTADKFYVERSTPEATLQFIKSDINKSEDNYADVTIANNYDKTLWSKAATLMLKAEIYMWSAKVTITGHTATGTEDLKVAKSALSQVVGKFNYCLIMKVYSVLPTVIIKKLFSPCILQTVKQQTGEVNSYIRMLYLSDRYMGVTGKRYRMIR